jgi:putative FmdB family regulatory protein
VACNINATPDLIESYSEETIIMPTYEFYCKKCAKPFEWIASISEYERRRKEGMQCPDCDSTDVVQQISAFQVKTSKKS